MQNTGFHFEIHDLLVQFVAAMDDVVISRFNKNREEKEKIKVRYVHAPKERVLFDIVNKAQSLTLPVISINISGISRDESRVFNKIEGIHAYVNDDRYGKYSARVPMPVPVNVSVNMSIMTRFQTDMDQIISNFVPYSNPYIVVSWKIPEKFNIGDIKEITSKILWDGNISLEYPVDMDATTRPRFIANTSFVIQGWLFPMEPKDLSNNIFFIDSHFHVTSKYNLNYDSYVNSLTADNYVYDPAKGLLNENETVSVSAAPVITNIFRNTTKGLFELSGNKVLLKNKNQALTFSILGQNLDYTKNILLSSDSSTIYQNLTSYAFTYYPTVSGFLLPKSNYTVYDKNLINVVLPSLSSTGEINFVVVNEVGWKDTKSINTNITFVNE
jgi:hypothetical protein